MVQRHPPPHTQTESPIPQCSSGSSPRLFFSWTNLYWSRPCLGVPTMALEEHRGHWTSTVPLFQMEVPPSEKNTKGGDSVFSSLTQQNATKRPILLHRGLLIFVSVKITLNPWRTHCTHWFLFKHIDTVHRYQQTVLMMKIMSHEPLSHKDSGK